MLLLCGSSTPRWRVRPSMTCVHSRLATIILVTVTLSWDRSQNSPYCRALVCPSPNFVLIPPTWSPSWNVFWVESPHPCPRELVMAWRPSQRTWECWSLTHTCWNPSLLLQRNPATYRIHGRHRTISCRCLLISLPLPQPLVPHYINSLWPMAPYGDIDLGQHWFR